MASRGAMQACIMLMFADIYVQAVIRNEDSPAMLLEPWARPHEAEHEARGSTFIVDPPTLQRRELMALTTVAVV